MAQGLRVNLNFAGIAAHRTQFCAGGRGDKQIHIRRHNPVGVRRLVCAGFLIYQLEALRLFGTALLRATGRNAQEEKTCRDVFNGLHVGSQFWTMVSA